MLGKAEKCVRICTWVLQILARKIFPLQAELPKLSKLLFPTHNTENVISVVSVSNCQRYSCLESP